MQFLIGCDLNKKNHQKPLSGNRKYNTVYIIYFFNQFVNQVSETPPKPLDRKRPSLHMAFKRSMNLCYC